MSAAPRTSAGLYDLMVREGMNPVGPRPKDRPRRDNAEHRTQAALIVWWNRAHIDYGVPEILLFSIPNGGWRDPIGARILKTEGQRNGVSDLFLSVSRGGFHGLYVEMKAPEGYTSPEQRAFLKSVGDQGYLGRVCYSCESAMNEIAGYLKL